jgi:hypothetical protein
MIEGVVSLASSARRPRWAFVVGRSFLAAVPADTADVVVRALAAFAPHREVDLESMVTHLPLSGGNALDSFALVVPAPATSPDDAGVSVLVRGRLAVDVYSVGGSRRFAAAGVLPWLLADFQAVTGIVVGDVETPPGPLEGTGTGTGFASTTGNGDRLTWQVRADEPPVDTFSAVPTRAIAVAGDTLARRGTATGDTVVLPSSPRWASADAEAAPGIGQKRPRFGFLLGGTDYRLDASYYLGRQPHAPRIQAAGTPTLLAVPSPTRSVSGTHLEIRQDGDAVVVTDLGSTNGTVLIPPGGAGERLRQGSSRTVLPGTRVDIGDGNIVEILPVSGDDPSLPPAKNRKAQP